MDGDVVQVGTWLPSFINFIACIRLVSGFIEAPLVFCLLIAKIKSVALNTLQLYDVFFVFAKPEKKEAAVLPGNAVPECGYPT